MSSFDIVKEITPPKSFRAQAVIGNFNIDASHIAEHFQGQIDLPEEWNIGLIVGGSGTGKSTIAKECFPADYISGYTYGAECILDDMPQDKSIKDIELAFTSVGFASAPSWLKPYNVLSNGEKMRVDLARSILEDRDTVVFDEFTSVVDRTVARTASCAISKAVRRLGKKFVAVSCHKDITEWLCPDWIYDTDENCFFTQGESSTALQSTSRYIGLTANIETKYGRYLESITI